eukprot:gb/GEZN01006570.1/.p1 GENE.gb/GEZN01006570.1/~~gb/GEZN01006570.1/.p1  ORF type:complete len:528 (-),score=90.60 gb/GEZN01006570.1/:3-1586(-)
MVVLAAAVMTKPGKVVLSRQFVNMTRGRVETLLANFPKLIATDSSQKQHTFIETDDVRYVYQPIEQLYLLLVTTRQSNIMEDLETLRLLSQLLPEYCGGNTESNVREKGFELCFAFDEAVSMGYQDNVTLSQVKTFMEMDSHEEILSDLIKKGKENEAREEARRKAESISKAKDQMKKTGGGGSLSQEADTNDGDYESSPTKPVKAEKEKKKKKKKKESVKQDVTSSAATGMQLGAKPKGGDAFLDALHREEKLTTTPSAAAAAVTAAVLGVSDDGDEGFSGNPVAISCIEKLTVEMDRSGGIKSLAVSGELKLTVFDPEWARIRLKTNGVLAKEFKSRLHPKVSPKDYKKSGTLQLADSARPFPTGTDNAPVILRWVMKTEDEAQLPFSVNFWPTAEDDNTQVDITLELVKEELVLKNLVITIPCPADDAPEVAEHDGEFSYEARKKQLVWRVPELSAETPKVSLEFSCDVEPDEMYPLSINFESDTTYSNLQVESVEKVEDGTELDEVPQKSQLIVNKFEVSGEE